MPNNTETYWDADGVSLHTFAWSIETLSGLGPPDLRGEDHVIPTRMGEVWVPKTVGSNVLTLAMWLRGIPEHASNVEGTASKAQYQSNWNNLIRTLWKPWKQIDLRKRFYDNNILKTATAKAEYKGGLQPTMMGNKAGRCTVDMKIAGGLFYDEVETTHTLVNGNNTLEILGNAPTNRISVTIAGARTNAKLINSTLGVEFTYPRTINGGLNAVVDVENFTVTDSSVPGVDMAASVIHTGAPQWLTLIPGTNVINLSSSSGAGVVTLKYRAAWV
jgi:hypothetical protein